MLTSMLCSHSMGTRVPAFADLVCYWFERARGMLERSKAQRCGLLATNSIRGGANRAVLERILKTGGIFWAWSDRPWILDGAAVRISMIGFDGGLASDHYLDGLPVSHINPDLTSSLGLTQAQPLVENQGLGFRGNQKAGAFDIDEATARVMLDGPLKSKQPTKQRCHSQVGKRHGYCSPFARDVDNRLWRANAAKEAEQYELPFQHIEKHVRPK